jgi:hypothetical protein
MDEIAFNGVAGTPYSPNTTMQPPIGAHRFRLTRGLARADCG